MEGSGAGSVPMPIPNDAALAQSTLFGQWGVTAPTANALGLVFSHVRNAARISVRLRPAVMASSLTTGLEAWRRRL